MDKIIINQQATSGQVFICEECGKKSYWKYGYDNRGNTVSDHGWDKNCTLNSVLYYDKPVIDRISGYLHWQSVQS